MKVSPAQLVRRLAELAPLPTSDPAPDAVLLERFIGQRDEAAFSVMVARHGPMVLRLCRRVLGNAHDADDAFQATFLVLARKAGAIRRRHHLAAWLHGAAYRLALRARATNAQRHRGEVSASVPEPADLHPDPLTRMTARELLAALDEELVRLPEVYRLPLVLCCLEGRTQEEAAHQLGWTPGSVKGRLERGRARLHARLVRRGLDLSACLLALEALHGPAVSGVPSALLVSTTRAGALFAAGVRNAGQAAAPVVALAEGMLKTMLLTKLKIATAVLVVVACLGTQVGGFAFRMQAAGEEARSKGGASVGGDAPSEKNGTAKGLKLTLSADKTETVMKPNGSNAVPVKLKLTFTNGSDKDVTVNAHVLKWRLRLHCTGPDPDSVRTLIEYIRRPQGFLPAPAAKDTIVLRPSKSCSPDWTPSFPGEIPEGFAKTVVYNLHKPGTYKLQVTLYKNLLAGDEKEAELTPWLKSNELELTVREKRWAGEGGEDPEKERFSTRKGNTITLHPDNATFRVYDQMLNWYARFKNNFHLTRAELAKVENGAGDWDTEYALVCNAVLPFSRCYAHVGDEGWGKDGVGYLDLQARVYVLKKTLAQVKRLIEERGVAKVKEITKKPSAVTTGDAGGWKRWKLAYQRWYGDYGGTANVDFCARPFDGQTVVFVFMYTEIKRFPQEAKVRAMLESFTWPGNGKQKEDKKAAPAQAAFPSEKDSTAKLLKDLDKDDPIIRAAAIDLLAKRKVMAAVPRLIELLRDFRALIGSDNWVGGHAANALQAITGQRFYLDHDAWRRWWARQQADK